MTDGRGTGETVIDGTSVGGGRGTEMEGVVDRKCKWKGLESPARDGGGSRGHRVVGGRDDGLEPKGGGGGRRSIATGSGRKPVGGCYSAEIRRPAIRSTAHDPKSNMAAEVTLGHRRFAVIWTICMLVGLARCMNDVSRTINVQ